MHIIQYNYYGLHHHLSPNLLLQPHLTGTLYCKLEWPTKADHVTILACKFLLVLSNSFHTFWIAVEPESVDISPTLLLAITVSAIPDLESCTGRWVLRECNAFRRSILFLLPAGAREQTNFPPNLFMTSIKRQLCCLCSRSTATKNHASSIMVSLDTP